MSEGNKFSRSMFGRVHGLQQLKDPKSQRVGQRLLDDPRCEALERLSSLHQHLHLPEDALLRYGMLSEDMALDLSSDDLKRMGD